MAGIEHIKELQRRQLAELKNLQARHAQELEAALAALCEPVQLGGMQFNAGVDVGLEPIHSNLSIHNFSALCEPASAAGGFSAAPFPAAAGSSQAFAAAVLQGGSVADSTHRGVPLPRGVCAASEALLAASGFTWNEVDGEALFIAGEVGMDLPATTMNYRPAAPSSAKDIQAIWTQEPVCAWVSSNLTFHDQLGQWFTRSPLRPSDLPHEWLPPKLTDTSPCHHHTYMCVRHCTSSRYKGWWFDLSGWPNGKRGRRKVSHEFRVQDTLATGPWLGILLVADALQRKMFADPQHRRVHFALFPGELQWVPSTAVGTAKSSAQHKPIAVPYWPTGQPPSAAEQRLLLADVHGMVGQPLSGQGPPFVVGQAVIADWLGTGDFWGGVIARANADGTYDIKWSADGTMELSVPRYRIESDPESTPTGEEPESGCEQAGGTVGGAKRRRGQ